MRCWISDKYITWDFSSLKEDSAIGKEVVLPDSTTYATSFEEANICFKNSDGKLYYYSIRGNEYEYHGTYNGTFIIKGDHENHQKLLTFPFTYQSNFTDSFTNQYEILGMPFYRKGTITSEADAYGDIKLPGGTIKNVLRVKWTESFIDSSFIGNINGSIETYVWYKPGYPHNMFTYSKTTNNGTDEYYGAFLKNPPVTTTSVFGLDNGKQQNIAIFPNPTSHDINIHLPDVENNSESVEVTVLGIAGDTKSKLKFEFLDEINIDVSNFPPGPYLILVKNGNHFWNAKFNKL